MYLRNYDGLIYKLSKTDPASVSEEVANKHFESIKLITKCFTDRENENFRECSPYTPFLAWASQFYVLTQHARNEVKVERAVLSIVKDIENK